MTGTKIRKHPAVPEKSFGKPNVASEASSDQSLSSSEADFRKDLLDREETSVKNPYAGHLENQRISRLIQVQADAIEDDGIVLTFISFLPRFIMKLALSFGDI